MHEYTLSISDVIWEGRCDLEMSLHEAKHELILVNEPVGAR